MRVFPHPVLLTMSIPGLMLWGCTAPGPSPLNYTLRQVRAVDQAAALHMAQMALLELDYSLESVDHTSGRITTVPVDRLAANEPGSARVASGRARLREIAEVRVEPAEAEFRVFIKVLIQQQTTETHRLFAIERRSSDSPGTPIERDAATTREQNTVWQTLRRDKAAERRIAETIQRLAANES